MRRFTMLIAAAAVAFSTAAIAEQRASTEDAKKMALKAVEHIKAAGKEVAFKSFTGKADGWVDRDLYVFVVDNSGNVTAHGASAVLVGKNLSQIKDVDGKPFVKEKMDIKDQGWVDYKWKNPQTNAVEAKTSYVVRVGDAVVGVGAYK